MSGNVEVRCDNCDSICYPEPEIGGRRWVCPYACIRLGEGEAVEYR